MLLPHCSRFYCFVASLVFGSYLLPPVFAGDTPSTAPKPRIDWVDGPVSAGVRDASSVRKNEKVIFSTW